MPFMDYTTARAIDDMIRDASGAGKRIYLVGMRPSLEKLLRKAGILQTIPAEQQCHKRLDALQKAVAGWVD